MAKSKNIRHVWKKTSSKTYICKNCGLGVIVNEFESKSSIGYALKRRGFSSDCRIERIRNLVEE